MFNVRRKEKPCSLISQKRFMTISRVLSHVDLNIIDQRHYPLPQQYLAEEPKLDLKVFSKTARIVVDHSLGVTKGLKKGIDLAVSHIVIGTGKSDRQSTIYVKGFLLHSSNRRHELRSVSPTKRKESVNTETEKSRQCLTFMMRCSRVPFP